MNIFSILYYLSLPSMYFAYIIYIRLLRTVIPRDLQLFPATMLMFSTIFVLFGLSIRLYLLLKNEGIIKKKSHNNKYINNMKNFIVTVAQHLAEIMSAFINIVGNYFESFNRFSINLVRIFYIVTKKEILVFIVFLFDLLPKLLVLAAFLIDVFHFKQLNYFYKTVALLLLPVVFSLLKTIIEEYYKQNIQDIIYVMGSKPIPGSENHEFCFNEQRIIPDFFGNFNYFFAMYFTPIFEIPYNFGDLEFIKQKYHFSKINILSCILYMIGWTQILLLGLGII